MKWIILILVLFIILVLYSGYSAQEDAKKKAVLLDSLRKKISDLFSVTPTIQFEGELSSYILAIDDSAEKIVYVTEKEETLIDYSSVLSVELIEDEMTIQKKSSTRTIGGALVGGVLSGGVGAVIGGLSGCTTENTKVSHLAIKILLKDIKKNDTFHSISDELEKLYNLKEKGIITSEEFNTQKKLMLNG